MATLKDRLREREREVGLLGDCRKVLMQLMLIPMSYPASFHPPKGMHFLTAVFEVECGTSISLPDSSTLNDDGCCSV